MKRSLPRACGALLVCAAVAAPSRAQEMPAPPLPVIPPPAAKAAAAPPVDRNLIQPTERSSEVQAHWTARRNYVRDRDERRADDEQQRVRALKDELAVENLFFIGAALVRESQEALAGGSPAVAVERCKLAVEFAPALPEAHTCLARALISDSPGNVKAIATELVSAVTAGSKDPRISRAATANALGVLLAGLFAAGLAFVFVLFVRYASLYAHDVHHLFPVGARRWQTKMLAAVILLLPVFLQMGPIPLIFTVLIACGLYFTRLEAVLAVLLLGLLAASPWMAASIAKVGTFGGAAVDVWLVEHGLGTGPEVQRLQKRMEAANELPVDFALAHKAKRDGDFAAAEKLYLRALDAPGATGPGLAAVHNNLGNVYLLQGDTAKALQRYQQAIDIREGLAAPHFNVSRALGLGGVETLEKVQAEQARALDLDRAAVDRFTGGQLQANKHANKFVMDVGLDDELLAAMVDSEGKLSEPVGDEVRARLAGGLPTEIAWVVPLIVAGALIALQAARGRVRPSGRCDRCGREVCKRCDPDARPSEQLCAQCVNVFIRRTGVDAAERQRKEDAVQAYHRRRHLLARLLAVLSGAGHVMLGYPLRGLFWLVVTGSLAASVILWRGLLHDPIAVRSGLSWLRIGLTAAVVVAVYAICLRDLFARQRAEEGV